MMDDSANHGAETASRDTASDRAGQERGENSGDAHFEASRLRGLRDSLDRAWKRVRSRMAASPSGDGSFPRKESPVSVDAPSEPSLHSAFGEFSTLGAAVADDALALAKAWGVSVSDLVRRHPVRAVLIAGLAGAAIGIALRAHRKPVERA